LVFLLVVSSLPFSGPSASSSSFLVLFLVFSSPSSTYRSVQTTARQINFEKNFDWQKRG